MNNIWPYLFLPLLGALALSGCGMSVRQFDRSDIAAEVPISPNNKQPRTNSKKPKSLITAPGRLHVPMKFSANDYIGFANSMRQTGFWWWTLIHH